MRTITKPTTAQCNLPIYTLFLLCEPKYISCVRLAQILEDLSHDSVNRFLWRENYTSKDLFDEVASQIELEGGTLSVDDMVVDKLYSDPKKAELIDYFWSGKKKQSKGLTLLPYIILTLRGCQFLSITELLINRKERQNMNIF